MRLLFEFNLIFLLVFLAALAGGAYVSRNLPRLNAQQEILERARLTMEKAIAVRTYTSEQIRPLLKTQMMYTFLPQSVPAYSATEVPHQLAKAFPEYTYKEAALNPTNPRDRAVDWESDIVTRFRSQSDQKELVGERDTPLGRALYIARPPVPMSVPLGRADNTFRVFMTSLVGIFVAIGVALNLMPWALVIRPVTKLSRLADRVSMGEVGAPEFKARGRDEIGRLAESLTRMRRSLEQAMKMLGA
jgi:HAMP domain-containing protein